MRPGQSHVTNDNFITDADMVARYECRRVQDYSEMAVWRNYEAIPVIPTLVFDLLDPAANTNTLLTDTVNNVALTAPGDPNATWLTNYEGFARVLSAPNPTSAHAYNADWANIYPLFGGTAPGTLWPHDVSFSVVFFSTSEGINTARSGMSSVTEQPNHVQIAGWQGYQGNISYDGMSGVGHYKKVNYAGYPAVTNIGFYAFTMEALGNNKCYVRKTKSETGFTGLEDVGIVDAPNPTLYDHGIFWILKSSEVSYYFHGKFAGYAMYKGVLTDAQLTQIYNSKSFNIN